MPFNQLLLPLIGGYLLIAFTHISSHWASRQSKEQLILVSAAAGFVSLIVARVLAVLLVRTDIGTAIYQTIHKAAPYQGIGTALLSVLLCLLVILWVNYVWPKNEAMLWLYSTTDTYNNLEKLLLTSALPVRATRTHSLIQELLIRLFLHPPLNLWDFLACKIKRLFCESTQAPSKSKPFSKPIDPLPVMLTLKDRKVYVGYVKWIPPLIVNGSPYITIVPVWSGYRDPNSLKVFPTENYKDEFFNAQSPNGKVIAIGDIVNASLYDSKTFAKFSDAATEPENKEDSEDDEHQPAVASILWDRLKRRLGW